MAVIMILLTSCGRYSTGKPNFKIVYMDVEEGNISLPVKTEQIFKIKTSEDILKKNQSKKITVDGIDYSGTYNETVSYGIYPDPSDFYEDREKRIIFAIDSDGVVVLLNTGVRSEGDYMSNLLSNEEYEKIAKETIYRIFDKEEIGDEMRIVRNFADNFDQIAFEFSKKIGDFETRSAKISLNNKGELIEVARINRGADSIDNINVNKEECDEYVLENLKKTFENNPDYQFEISSRTPIKLADGSVGINYTIEVHSMKNSETLDLFLYI